MFEIVLQFISSHFCADFFQQHFYILFLFFVRDHNKRATRNKMFPKLKTRKKLSLDVQHVVARYGVMSFPTATAIVSPTSIGKSFSIRARAVFSTRWWIKMPGSHTLRKRARHARIADIIKFLSILRFLRERM